MTLRELALVCGFLIVVNLIVATFLVKMIYTEAWNRGRLDLAKEIITYGLDEINDTISSLEAQVKHYQDKKEMIPL